MKDMRAIMGMPVTVEIVGAQIEELDYIFSYFSMVDGRFSTYKITSEISMLNRGEIVAQEYSEDMKEVLELCEETRLKTDGYFDIRTLEGPLDPSGLVKGWAINNAAYLIRSSGFENFWVDAGGDIQTGGTNADGKEWSVGIRNPFHPGEIVKVLYPRGKGIATSGTYTRGQHIYNPITGESTPSAMVSLTVIGPDVYEADRFATAAFAMGREGVSFIESLEGFEAYSIDVDKQATVTAGFGAFTS